MTPNREELQYTDKTRKKLYEVIAKTKEEIQKIIKEKIQTSFNTLNEAYNFYEQGVNYPISDRININIRNIAGLADLIEVDKNKINNNEYMKYFSKIKSNRIFVKI